MSKDRLFFIRYFNATFLWVCPSTEIISRFVSIVNTRFTNPNRFVSTDLMILNVKLRVLFRQLIVHHCDKIEWSPRRLPGTSCCPQIFCIMYYSIVCYTLLRGLSLYLAVFSADLSEGGLLPVTQSFWRGFLERRAFLGSLPPFLPRYSLPFFVIDPIRYYKRFDRIISIYRFVELRN